jgi:uncharacterized membrane protein (Fun14 family)
VTNQNKRRRPPPGGYRQPPAADAAAPRRGFLDSIFPSAAPGSTPFPRAFASIGRGILYVVSTPALLVAVPVLLVAVWFAVVAAGYQGPFITMQLAFALPPLGTVGDTTIAGALSGGVGAGGLVSAFAFLFWRALLISVLTTALVERVRTGSVSGWALRRMFRVLPLAIGINFLSLFLLIVANVIAAFFGSGLQTLVSVAALALGIYLSAYVTTIAADEDRTQTDTARRGLRVARQPGSGNLWISALYVLVNFVLLLLPLPGGLVGVNPSISAWAVVTVVNVLHVGVLGAFVYRYLVAAPEIDDAPRPRRTPPPRRR